jgi:hypothetical protein
MGIVSLGAGVYIKSPLSLEEVAQKVSEAAFACLPFGGRDEYIFDEVAAVYIQTHPLGLDVILQGFGGADGYYLEIRSKKFPFRPFDLNAPFDLSLSPDSVDITENLLYLLRGVEGINVRVSGR